MLLFIFFDKNGFKKQRTFDKKEITSKDKMFRSKRFRILLKSLVNGIEQVICQMVVHPKNISDQQLQTLNNNKASVSQRCIARRFALSQSTIRRNKHRLELIKEDQQRTKSNCRKTFFKLSIDFR